MEYKEVCFLPRNASSNSWEVARFHETLRHAKWHFEGICSFYVKKNCVLNYRTIFKNKFNLLKAFRHICKLVKHSFILSWGDRTNLVATGKLKEKRKWRRSREKYLNGWPSGMVKRKTFQFIRNIKDCPRWKNINADTIHPGTQWVNYSLADKGEKSLKVPY